ncbi:Protein of unknown function [Marinospirillum celere]|uniref:Outer membrane lipoprotein-sorting protein n=1 Tax=Marinospirillum celere TaxID=1122252 RepID=A0A1I1HWU5_9GAMM|nr:DUF1329 domain-containing protein [Marinospirillum celere]SFC28567.1 Protein of unknown function [Marinospirillum celere]
MKSNKTNPALRLSGLATALVAAGLLATTGSLYAAERLGGSELTPMGAERAGSADGRIPAWDGGLQEGPGNWRDGYGHPFADEEPLYVITAQNYQQYEERLAPGQIAMLQAYPDTFRIPVYPTHRTAAYPDSVYEKVKSNASSARLVDGGNGVENFTEVTPFPIPETGVELVWNHSTRYRGPGAEREVTLATPQASGAYTPVTINEEFMFIADAEENTLFHFLQSVTAPARLSGTILLVQETMNQVLEPRRAWIYNAGQRRVRRAPQVAYDGPGTAADGQRTSDGLDVFNGAPDRYEWNLVGKKEMYIPYNAYNLLDTNLSNDDIIMAGHLNPDHLRYELHRVWKVEGTLREGQRHIYEKRVMYFDEDTYQLAHVDQYDGRGNLWRVSEGHTVQFHDVQVPWYAAETIYDLVNNRYIVSGLINDTSGYNWDYEARSSNFTPAALRRSGGR